MTTDRPLPAAHRFARAGIALAIVGAAVLGALAACGGDDSEPNNFIGITDAEPPRLGARPDGG